MDARKYGNAGAIIEQKLACVIEGTGFLFQTKPKYRHRRAWMD